jgi:hypothetical protein
LIHPAQTAESQALHLPSEQLPSQQLPSQQLPSEQLAAEQLPSEQLPAEQPGGQPLVDGRLLGDPLPDAFSEKITLRLHGVVLDESRVLSSPVLAYLRMAIGMIEGRPFSHQEIVGLLRQALRQHSIARRTRREYVLGFLHQHPP